MTSSSINTVLSLIIGLGIPLAILVNIVAAPFVSLGRLRRLLTEQGYELLTHRRLNAYTHDGSAKWVDVFSITAKRGDVQREGTVSMKNFFLLAGVPVIKWNDEK